MNSSSAATGATTVWPDLQQESRSAWSRTGVAAGIEHPSQQVQSLKPLADSSQISSSRVARGTLSIPVEVLAAGGGVAGGEVRRFHGTPATPELGEFVHLAVQKSYDGAQIVVTEVVEGGHSRVRPAGPNHRPDLVAAGVLSDAVPRG